MSREMKRVPSPKQDRSRKTEAAILAATEALIAGKPLDQIAISEIAREAGISVGNFYNRFPDKEALLLTLYGTYESERTKLLQETFDPINWRGASLEARARGVVEFFVDFFWARRALIRSFVLYYRTSPEKAPEALRNRLKGISRVATQTLAEGMSGSKDDRMVAALGLQTIIALTREFILFSDDPSKKEIDLSRKALTDHLTFVLLSCLQR